MKNRTVLVSSAKHENDGVARVRLNNSYVAALENAGLVPLIVPPLASASEAAEVVRVAGGLLLTGGGDLDPALYGEPMHAKARQPQADRDTTELALIAAARAGKKPVLGICRGIQAVNVALGGTLVQDIASEVSTGIKHDAHDLRDSRTHPVSITPGSRLAKAIGATEIAVNSLHHQSVARVAPGLHVSARSPDGVIEGLETGDDWWVLCVQWHPEELDRTEEPWDRGLFQAFSHAVTGGS